jgi:hypothetical protein
VVTDTGEVLDPSAPDQNHRVFLEVMADAGDISGYFGAVGKTHTGYLP